MPELEFQDKVAEPLLRAEGFTDVTPWSGRLEKGKDLVAIKEEFGIPKLYAIQIKRVQFSANATSRRSVARLIPQLRQLFGERVPDPRRLVGERSYPDRGMLMTPYPMTAEQRLSVEDLIKSELERQDFTILEGNRLLNILAKSLPPVLATVCDDYSYSLSMATEANLIRESQAFGIARTLTVDSIYVDMSLGAGSSSLSYCPNCAPPRRGIMKILAVPDDMRALAELAARDWGVAGLSKGKDEVSTKRHHDKLRASIPRVELAKRPEETEGDFKRRTKEAQKEAFDRRWRGRLPNVYRVNLDSLLLPAHAQLREALVALGSISIEVTSPANADASFRTAHEISTRYARLRHSAIIAEHCSFLFKHTPQYHKDERFPTLRSKALVLTGINLVILGPPGGGKTTLLRHLIRDNALATDSREPLLVDLVTVRNPSVAGLLDACADAVRRHAAAATPRQVHDRLTKGTYRVFFDGLDEAALHADTMIESIAEFMRRFSNCQVMVTCRDVVYQSLRASFDELIHVRIAPFSDDDLKDFVGNWFSGEPGKLGSVMEWLNAHLELKEAARVPMIAAQVCALFEANANELPLSPLDLYEKRLELLSGRWEEAKGITPLPANVRRRYIHYLMKLAYTVHSLESRYTKKEIAIEMAREYYVPRLHGTPEALLADCKNRGLLVEDVPGYIGFGHLTYQEHLAARWLDHENDIDQIAPLLGKSWWWIALEFYSSMKLDITPLVKRVLSQESRDEVALKSLMRMLRSADLSDSDSAYKLEKMLERGAYRTVGQNVRG